MKFSIGTKVGVGYAFGIAALIGIGLASYMSVTRLVETVALKTHTYELLTQIDALLAELVNIETGQRGYTISGDESFLEPYELGMVKVPEHLAALRRMTADNPPQQELVRQIEPLVARRVAFTKEVTELQRNNNHEASVARTASGEGKKAMDEIRAVAGRMSETALRTLKTRSEATDANAKATLFIIVGGVSAAVLIKALIGFVLVQNISKPLQKLTHAAGRIASGDLNVDVGEHNRSDEVGELADAFSRMTTSLQQMAKVAEQVAAGNLAMRISPQSPQDVMGTALSTMVQRLSSLIGQVQKSGIQVNTSATEIAATAKQQQATAGEIFSTTTEIGATSQEISATAKELVKTVKGVTEIAGQTAALAANGQNGLTRMEGTMRQIMEASGSINTRLAVLSEKAGKINTVVTTITKVADQTNLLSLNAAIEAEKAGEAGRGFAVVASEIRRLADQTAIATSEIEKMVGEMQSAVSAGVMGMDKFSEEVRRGVEVVNEVSAQLVQIIQQVQTLTPNFETVNDGMQSQSLGAQQITEALAQLSEAAQQTVDSLRQSNVAIEQLNEATAGLQSGVSRFKLEA